MHFWSFAFRSAISDLYYFVQRIGFLTGRIEISALLRHYIVFYFSLFVITSQVCFKVRLE